MSQRPHKPTPVVVKRPPEQRRKLPPELEAFARSDEEKLRIRRPRTDKGTIRDPREGYTVAGVANRDARAVYDVRSVAMRELWDEGAADERALAQLGQLFHDALRLELWHARRLTSFAAFAEEVVGVPVARAEQLAEQAAERTGEPGTPLTEVAIALWLRTEAGLYEGDERARARVRTGEHGLVLELSVDLMEASTALAGVGARHLPLARRDDVRRDEMHDDRHEERRADRYDERHNERRDERHNERRDERHNERRDEPRAERLEQRHHDDRRDEPRAELEPAFREPELAAVEDEPSAEPIPAEGAEDESAKPVVGGARLLTRKAPSSREQLGDRVDGGEPWGRREPREERPHFGSGDRGAAPRDRGERPRFQDRGGPRQERGERPRFGNDRGEGARFGGGDKAGRGGFTPGRGNDRGERPRFGNDRGGFTPGRGNDRGGFTPGRGNDRGGFTQGGGNDRGERPRSDRGGFTQARGNDRGERPRSDRGGFAQARGNDRGERPRSDRGGFTQAGGNDRPRSDRGGFAQGRGNDRGERPRSDRGGFTQARGHDRGERPRSDRGGFTQAPRDRGASQGGFGGKPGKGFGARKQLPSAEGERAPSPPKRDRDDGEE